MIDTCYLGDVRAGLRQFHAAGIRARTCVTSPPYWGLRSYLPADHPHKAWEIGSEPTPEAFLAVMVDVFRLVRDVLTDDGTLWVNMGDSYAGDRSGASATASRRRDDAPVPRSDVRVAGLKPKDLVGMPWRLALALQADGWWLRRDIIWHKPNPMPESASDRPTTAHEYVFLLAKSERYFYDAEAIKEPCGSDTHARRAAWKTPDGWDTSSGEGGHGSIHKAGREKGRVKPVAGWASGGVPHSAMAHAAPAEREGKLLTRKVYPGNGVGFGHGTDGAERGRGRVKNNESFDAAMAVMPATRNKRSVWTIPTEPFPEAHFATFPRDLVRPCVLAGSALGDVVLDPFMGSGTTAAVALELGRHWIGCDLHAGYHAMQARRTAQRGLALA